jgi:hypothetical protein
MATIRTSVRYSTSRLVEQVFDCQDAIARLGLVADIVGAVRVTFDVTRLVGFPVRFASDAALVA